MKKPSLLTGLRRALPQLDAIMNAVTGVGTDRDKTSYSQFIDMPPLGVSTLEALYANVSLAQRIVDKIVDEAMREGFGLRRREGADPEQDKEDAHEIKELWNALQAEESRFLRGAKWGRLFGGGGLLLGCEGSGSMRTPQDDTKVTELKYLCDWTRDEMRVATYDSQGYPLTYYWTPKRPGGAPIQQAEFHRSRLILFPGATTTPYKRSQNEGWDLSVLQAVYEALLSYQSMWANTDAMFADASQAVVWVNGLIQSLAEDGGQQDVQARMRLMNLTRSVANAMYLDAGDESGKNREDFKVVDRPGLGGLDGIQKNYMTRVAGDSVTPETILFGSSPGGDAATGKSERMQWAGQVDAYRRNVLESRMLRIIRLLARQLGQDDPDSWEIEWPEVEKLDPLDQATADKMRIDAGVSLVTSQVLLPEELALSLRRLAPASKFEVNGEARVAAMEAGLAEVEAREMGMGKLEATAEITAANAPDPAPPAKAPAAKASKRKQTSKAKGRQTD